MSDLTTISSNENAILVKTEIDLQITTAKSYPRDMEKSLEKAKKMVRLSPKIANSCIYALPRKKKNEKTGEYENVLIEGPSVRLAEIMATSYGNLHAATRVLESDGKTITAQAVAWDLETNFKLTEEVKVKIVSNKGAPFSEDIQNLLANAARAKALRNALLKAIPRSLVEEVYAEAEKIIAGEEDTLPERRKKMLEEFAKINVSLEKVLKYIKKKSIEEITIKEMPTLIGIYNAMKDNIFESEASKEPSKTQQLNEDLKSEKNDEWVADYDNTQQA